MIGIVSYLVFFLILSLIFGIAVLGLNLQWGYTGLFNAGIAGFVGIGAYTMAFLRVGRGMRYLVVLNCHSLLDCLAL